MQKLIAFTILIASALLYLAYQPYVVLADRAEDAVRVASENVAWAQTQAYGPLPGTMGFILDGGRAREHAHMIWLDAACDVVQAQMRAADLRYDVRM